MRIIYKRFGGFAHYVIFVLLNSLLTLSFVSFSLTSNIDIGQAELNYWYGEYRSGWNEIFGNNFTWIMFLDQFSLLPVVSSSDTLIVILISKIMQFGILFLAVVSNRKAGVLLYFLLLPNAFLYSASVGRSSIDWTIVFLFAILSNRKRILFNLSGIFTLFHKYLLFVIYALTLLNRIIDKFRYLVLLFVVSVAFYFGSEILAFTNTLLLRGRYGNYAVFEGIALNSMLELFGRAILLMSPPVILYQSPVGFLFSIESLVFFLFFLKYRRFFKFFDYFLIIIIALIAVPFVYNILSAARYFSLVFVFTMIRVKLRQMEKFDGSYSNVPGKL
jgi:hypothetical protein